jgi:hypothetical protein
MSVISSLLAVSAAAEQLMQKGAELIDMGQKLQLGTLSIWMDGTHPHFSGLVLEEAKTRVSQWIAAAQLWLDAVEDQQAAIKSERLTDKLTDKEERALRSMLQRKRAKLKEKGVPIEKARKVFAKRIRDHRGKDPLA